MMTGFPWSRLRFLLWVFANWLFSLLLLIVFVDRLPRASLNNPTHLVVLGAGLDAQNQPGEILQTRLDLARQLLQQDPQLKALLSGGQGQDEGSSEALAMQSYLLKAGISADRLLLEDQSHSTRDNLKFSRELLAQQAGIVRPVILTSDFHWYRASLMAERQGWSEFGVQTSSTPWWQLLACWPREYLALINDLYLKDWLAAYHQ